jgi:5-methylcytosine-specific restriction protein A
MSERYGKIAEKLIHVHHLERLADTGERTIDPVKDLIPLCPNCHSVAHLKTPPLTITALRHLLFGNQSTPVLE